MDTNSITRRPSPLELLNEALSAQTPADRMCYAYPDHYDYRRQCWIVDGCVAKCGHSVQRPETSCYACHHSGERVRN